MKIAVSFLVVILVISIDAFPHTSHRLKRGFRSGAADRFSHGFGKRQDSFDDSLATEAVSHRFISNEELASLIMDNSNLARLFVDKFVDLNGNGYVDREELLDRLAKP